MREKFLRQAAGVAVVTMACGWTGHAAASGFALKEQSAEGLGDAFAGVTAKADNVNAAYYNPAGMTRIDDAQVAGTLTWIQPDIKFKGTNTQANGAIQTSGGGGGDAIKPTAIGSQFAVIPVNDDWRIGLSMTVPFGLRSQYKEDWVGRYQALSTSLTDYEFSPTLGYKVTDKLSVGGGARFGYLTGLMTKSIDFGAALAQAHVPGYAPGSADGGARVQGFDWGYGYTLGALYEFDKGTRVGLNYRSRVHYDVDGRVSYQSVPIALANMPNLINQAVKFKLTLPDSLTMGVYHEITPQWAVMSDVSWTHWSLFNTFNVVGADGATINNTNEHWQDTWFSSVGTSYQLNGRWKLRTGFAYDQSPTKDATRNPTIPDSNRYWTTVGAAYNLTDYTQLNLGYAHLFMDTAKVNVTTASGGTLTGKYDSHIDIVSASLGMKF